MIKPKANTDVNLSRIAKVQSYINQHYRDELRLSELAALVNMAPTSLCHIFKLYVNQPISKYIISVRINHVMQMLKTPNAAVKAIAFECGFSTLSNFNRLFKLATGMAEDAPIMACFLISTNFGFLIIQMPCKGFIYNGAPVSSSHQMLWHNT